jgi:hypothetical protein
VADELIDPEVPQQRPPWHLRIELENTHGQTVLTVDGSGFSPEAAYQDAMRFVRQAAETEGA